VASLEAAAEAIPDEGKGPMYLRAAEVLRQNNRAPESLTLLRKADERGVKSGELWVELGDELVSAGEFAPAAETYRKAAAALPKDPTVWELVGELEVRRGRPVEAQEAFRQSLKVHERALPHVALARLLLAAKDKTSAAQELELAMKAATGEEKRETRELAELLVSFDRKGDALKLLANLATEPEEATDAALQLRTARLARELGDKAVVKAACLRITDAGVHCP
jgi:Flp pilus assembly protein TadD